MEAAIHLARVAGFGVALPYQIHRVVLTLLLDRSTPFVGYGLASDHFGKYPTCFNVLPIPLFGVVPRSDLESLHIH